MLFLVVLSTQKRKQSQRYVVALGFLKASYDGYTLVGGAIRERERERNLDEIILRCSKAAVGKCFLIKFSNTVVLECLVQRLFF